MSQTAPASLRIDRIKRTKGFDKACQKAERFGRAWGYPYFGSWGIPCGAMEYETWECLAADGRRVAWATMMTESAHYLNGTVSETQLSHLQVDPALRGQGLGTKVLERVVKEARDTHKVLKVECQVPRVNIRWYRDRGFTVYKDEGDYCWMSCPAASNDDAADIKSYPSFRCGHPDLSAMDPISMLVNSLAIG